jgi:hypothetical protein
MAEPAISSFFFIQQISASERDMAPVTRTLLHESRGKLDTSSGSQARIGTPASDTPADAQKPSDLLTPVHVRYQSEYFVPSIAVASDPLLTSWVVPVRL